MITLENWRERMGADMRLRDYRPRTRSGYQLATRLFLDWANEEGLAPLGRRPPRAAVARDPAASSSRFP
jgi:hypothetical protein